MKKTSSGPWKRVGENLVRYVSSRTIYAVFRVPGKKSPIRVSLDTKDLQTAKGLLAAKREEILGAEAAAPPKTVQEIVEMYKGTLGSFSRSTIQYRSFIANRVGEAWGERLVSSVRPSELERWLAGQIQRGCTKATYNEYLRTVRQIFNLAVRDGALKSSPAALFREKKRDKPIRATPSDKEVAMILEDIRSNEANQMATESGDFIEFMALAGVGNSETAALRWKHIDFENDQITLFRNKTDSGYAIPLFPALKTFLEARYAKSDKLPESRVFVIDDPRKAIANSCRRLQLPHYTNRSFRRYFITRAIRKGVDVKTISKWQNHKDGGVLVLSTYSHVIADHEKEMAKKLA